MANPIFMIDVTEEGVIATHPGRFELPLLVAPVPDESRTESVATIRPMLVTTGCMNLSNRGFDFDSSFVSPRARSRFLAFGKMMRHLATHDPTGQKRLPPIAIFGHTDPSGDPEYNKTLSGRRAKSVFGVLVRDVALWEKLWSGPFGGDDWGTKSIQSMLSFVGGVPFYTGPIDGAKTPETKKQTADAIKAYKQARGIEPPDSLNTAAFRKVLFKEYMDELCRMPDGPPLVLDPKEGFLARGKDAAHKGDLMGCGEFNPVLLVSAEDEKRFEKAKTDKLIKEERDAAYEKDRRVLVYSFPHETLIDPKHWPCPTTGEGSAGCKQRFWSDSKQRLLRAEGEAREFEKTTDTMACRFYHAFARYSPCEAGVRLWTIRLRRDGAKKDPEPLARAAFVVHAGDTPQAPVLRGFTDDKGELVIPVLHETTTMTLAVDVFGLETPPPDGDAAAAPGAPGAPGAQSSGGTGGATAPGAGGGTGAGGANPPGAADQTGAGNEVAGVDTDRFEHEEQFLSMTLDAGALVPMSQDVLASEQRLYNLGFGRRAPGTMTDDERRRAVRAFQKQQGATVTGNLDDDTRARLKVAHEGGAPPAVTP
ncbi:MAG: peptidoglycan-binding protein [Planctomycetes bacterium]|nr:peptidoglycan-binding protein [Planctomycetota bacterium]